MENRKNTFLLRMNDYELAALNEKVAKTGYSREAFIRSVLNGNILMETPPIEYHKMINLLRNIANNMNQIAATANSTRIINSEKYNKNLQALNQVITEIMEAILLPKKVNDGNNKDMENQR